MVRFIRVSHPSLCRTLKNLCLLTLQIKQGSVFNDFRMASKKRYTEEQKEEILAFVEAEGRGGIAKASEKFGVSSVTISGWKKVKSGSSGSSAEGLEIDKNQFVKVMAGKGFAYTKMVNELTGEVVEEKSDPKIEALGLEFKAAPKNADPEKLYVSQTSPQIQVTMTFDKLLNILGIKPGQGPS